MITNTSANAAGSIGSELHDIKPPIVIPNDWAWLWWIVGAIAGLVALYYIWRWWRKKRQEAPFVAPVPAHVRAKLKLLEALQLIAQPKPFCIEVSDVTRIYLEERFNFHAPERTTEEFLRELAETDRLTPDQKESLGRFLESCDLVKFARYEPGEAELRALHESAVRLIEETEPQPQSGPAGKNPGTPAQN